VIVHYVEVDDIGAGFEDVGDFGTWWWGNARREEK
jgi:hypothetical protein